MVGLKASRTSPTRMLAGTLVGAKPVQLGLSTSPNMPPGLGPRSSRWHLGLRVADLISGAVTNRGPSYYAISTAPPDSTADKAAELVAEGYPRLQLKAGGVPWPKIS